MERLRSTSLNSNIVDWADTRFKEGLLQEQDLEQPDNLVAFNLREPVALHEEGHAAVAKSRGWGVDFKTVIPEGNTLGLTKVTPDTSKSQDELILDAIAISAGGEAAEEVCGIYDHRGCGSDRFRQRFLANLYIRLTGSIRNVSEILSEQRSNARGILGSIGMGVHRRASMRFLRAGSLT